MYCLALFEICSCYVMKGKRLDKYENIGWNKMAKHKFCPSLSKEKNLKGLVSDMFVQLTFYTYTTYGMSVE